MNKIEVFRTHIRINDYTLGDKPRLEKMFSIFDPLYHKDIPTGRVYDEETKSLRLPRGFNIYKLEQMFNCSASIKRYNDEKHLVINSGGNVFMKKPPRDDIQKTAIRFMCNIDEYSNLYGVPVQSVNLDTGKGKSYCSIASMIIMDMRSIIITSQNDWLKQWKKYISEYTNIDKKSVVIINGSQALSTLMKIDTDSNRVYLVNHSTLKSFAKTYGWNSLNEVFNKLKIGIKYYDEAHLNFDNMCAIESYTDVYKTFYVTATPDRSDMKESMIYGMFMENVPAISLFDRDEDPHASYTAIGFHSHPSALDVSTCRNHYGLDRNKYIAYLTGDTAHYKENGSPNFYKVAYILISKFLMKPGKLLIYIGVNKSILAVKRWIEYNFPEIVGDIGVYTSLSENKSDELNHKIILSTTKSAGAAVDIYGLVQVINLAEPFKSKVIAKQTLGRLRADNTRFIDVIDNGFKSTQAFYKFKKPIYNIYATKCSEIMMNDKQLDEQYQVCIEQRKDMIIPIYFYDQAIGSDGLINPIEFL